MDVRRDQLVRIECELRVVGGDTIESSEKSGPVQYKHGSGQLLEALETKLEGMKVGDEKSGVIKASEAFGAPDAQIERTIPRKEFPAGTKLETGARFEAKAPNGTPIVLEITRTTDEAIIAKVIHPLADKDLEFKVKVISVRPPPPPVPTQLADDLVVLDEE